MLLLTVLLSNTVLCEFDWWYIKFSLWKRLRDRFETREIIIEFKQNIKDVEMKKLNQTNTTKWWDLKSKTYYTACLSTRFLTRVLLRVSTRVLWRRVLLHKNVTYKKTFKFWFLKNIQMSDVQVYDQQSLETNFILKN